MLGACKRKWISEARTGPDDAVFDSPTAKLLELILERRCPALL
jgi:hypothetical protein